MNEAILPNFDLLIHGRVLKEFNAKIRPPEGNSAFGTSTGSCKRTVTVKGSITVNEMSV